MKVKNKWIILLLILGCIGYGFFMLYYLPMKESEKEQYAIQQTDARTHHVESVYQFQSKYMGDASNLVGLYNQLPLCNEPRTFQIDSENRNYILKYKNSTDSIGESSVKRDVLYNAIVSFCLIENLNQVSYEFKDMTYSFKRVMVEEQLGALNVNMLKARTWKNQVQKQLDNKDFINKFEGIK